MGKKRIKLKNNVFKLPKVQSTKEERLLKLETNLRNNLTKLTNKEIFSIKNKIAELEDELGIVH